MTIPPCDGRRPVRRPDLGFALRTSMFALVLLALCLVSHDARAAGNEGAQVWLSWSPSSVQSDLPAPGSTNNLYVRVVGAASFKGAELDLTWHVPGDEQCAALHSATLYPTSTSCTYLNRGVVVPIVLADDPGHVHLAWANTDANATCSAGGNVAIIQIAYDGCTDSATCFSLNCVKLVDEANVVTLADIAGRTATVRGGGGFCPGADAPPVLAPIASQSVNEGRTLAFIASASDPDGNCMTYSAAPLPPGATFTDGAFSWTPTLGQAGGYDVTVTADDHAGATASLPVHITVTPDQAPALTPIADRSVSQGGYVTFLVSASDADGDPLTYAAAPLPERAVFAAQTFSWTTTDAQLGPYDIVFTATDPAGLTSRDTMTVTVVENAPPVFTQTPDQTVIEGHYVSFILDASDPNGDPLSYAVLNPPAGSSFHGKIFGWIPGSGQAGAYSVEFTATDPFGQSDTEFVAITVTPNHAPALTPTPDQVVMENAFLIFTVSATDADGDAVTILASPIPPFASFSNGTFTWTPTYDQAGSYSVKITASDGYGGVSSDTVAIVVTNVNRPPVMTPVGDRPGQETHLLSFAVAATDPDGEPLTYTADPLPAGATFVGQTFSWTPAVGQAGTYYVTFTATDPFGLFSSSTSKMMIGPASDHAPVMDPVGNYTVNETETVSFTVSATDIDGDSLTYSVMPLPAGATFANQTFTWTPSIGQAGTYYLTFSAADHYGLTGSSVSQITVLGEPLNLTASLSWSPFGLDPDLESPGASNNLYVYVQGAASFKGAELDITWFPYASEAGCYEKLGSSFRTSTSCTYLNRGTTVPVVTADDPTHFHVAWANSVANTTCAGGGNAMYMQFAFDQCANPAGCFYLNALSVLDDTNDILNAVVVNPIATVLGGSYYCTVDARDHTPPAPRTSETRLVGVLPSVSSGGTEVQFVLASQARVAIDVFDAAGVRVRTLRDETFSAGTHHVRWDGAGADGRPVPAGVYLVRWSANDARETRRVFVVR